MFSTLAQIVAAVVVCIVIYGLPALYFSHFMATGEFHGTAAVIVYLVAFSILTILSTIVALIVGMVAFGGVHGATAYAFSYFLVAFWLLIGVPGTYLRSIARRDRTRT